VFTVGAQTPTMGASAQSPGWAIRLLGPLEVCDGGRLIEVSGVRRQAVLALLVLAAERSVSLDQLVARLWPDRPPATAAAAVRNSISALRRLLRPLETVSIDTVGSAYVLRLPPGLLDVTVARDRCEHGLRLLDGGEVEQAGRELRRSLNLWRGSPLPALRQAGYAWSEVADLDELRLRTVEGLVETALRRGRHRECVPGLQNLVRQYPEREGFHRQRVVALAGAGRPADAVAAYHDARAALLDAGHTVGVGLTEAHRVVLEHGASTGPGRGHRAARRRRVPERGVTRRARPASRSGARSVAVLCVRFGADADGREQDAVDLASSTGAVMTRHDAGVVVALFAAGDEDGTDLAVETALALRRRSRAAGAAPPAIAVITGRAPAPEGAGPGARAEGWLVALGVQLARRTAPGGLSVR
jgi:DNA-binding SARP family transcriptional activator